MDTKMQNPRTGEMIADRYAIRQRVGKGRMSSVYRAADTAADDSDVAIKLLDTSHSDDFKRVVFKRETTALKQLRHPNIVGLQQSGWPDGDDFPFLILDYLPYSLDKHLSGAESPPVEFNQFRAMRELADAVAYAHSHNVVHRDIKPSNILLDRNGRPHLADFGISKLLDQLTVGETLDGYWSGGYASPEQRGSRPIDLKTDIYSLGAVFYHLLSGRIPPPDGPTPMMVDNDCRSHPIPLRNIVKRMLVPRPEDRAYSASELVVALERVTQQVEDLPIHQLILTNNAMRDLRREGYIMSEYFDEASEVIRDNLGGDSRAEAYVQRDRHDKDDVQILGDSLRLICAADSGALVVKAVHTPFLPDL